ncbi:MAG: TetR/AcrR family transcriptional regulator [Pseudomonadota bacterium]
MIADTAAKGLSKLERTRQQLVHAIRNEIRESGNFTADLVAQRAGTSPATFYNHFATKDEALMAAYEALMIDLVDLVSEQCRIEKLLDEGLRVFNANWLMNASVFFARNASLFLLSQPAIQHSKALRKVFRQYEESAIQAYKRFIELGQSARLIRTGDSLAMAQALAVITEGWYHPLIQKLEQGSPIHLEMTEALTRVLAPNES